MYLQNNSGKVSYVARFPNIQHTLTKWVLIHVKLPNILADIYALRAHTSTPSNLMV